MLKDIFCIIGHEADRVRKTVESYGTGFVEQREQRGTGHALMQCREALAGYEHVLVLSGDVPLIRTETITAVRDFHVDKHSDMTILTAEPPIPSAMDAFCVVWWMERRRMRSKRLSNKNSSSPVSKMCGRSIPASMRST